MQMISATPANAVVRLGLCWQWMCTLGAYAQNHCCLWKAHTVGGWEGSVHAECPPRISWVCFILCFKFIVVCFIPDEYKSKVACEDDKLRLSCKKSMVIAIYSAIFGRTQGGSLECPYQNLGVPMIGKQGNGLTDHTDLRSVISFTVFVVERAQLLIRKRTRACSLLWWCSWCVVLC